MTSGCRRCSILDGGVSECEKWAVCSSVSCTETLCVPRRKVVIASCFFPSLTQTSLENQSIKNMSVENSVRPSLLSNLDWRALRFSETEREEGRDSTSEFRTGRRRPDGRLGRRTVRRGKSSPLVRPSSVRRASAGVTVGRITSYATTHAPTPRAAPFDHDGVRRVASSPAAAAALLPSVLPCCHTRSRVTGLFLIRESWNKFMG